MRTDYSPHSISGRRRSFRVKDGDEDKTKRLNFSTRPLLTQTIFWEQDPHIFRDMNRGKEIEGRQKGWWRQ